LFLFSSNLTNNAQFTTLLRSIPATTNVVSTTGFLLRRKRLGKIIEKKNVDKKRFRFVSSAIATKAIPSRSNVWLKNLTEALKGFQFYVYYNT
jgi:hypothetical protein